jgi:hypothetical protein
VRGIREGHVWCVNCREHSSSFREHLVSFREHLVSFREHSVSFREHSSSFKEHSGNIQGTFGLIQGTFGLIQGIFGLIQGTFVLVQGTFREHSGNIQKTFSFLISSALSVWFPSTMSSTSALTYRMRGSSSASNSTVTGLDASMSLSGLPPPVTASSAVPGAAHPSFGVVSASHARSQSTRTTGARGSTP